MLIDGIRVTTGSYRQVLGSDGASEATERGDSARRMYDLCCLPGINASQWQVDWLSLGGANAKLETALENCFKQLVASKAPGHD